MCMSACLWAELDGVVYGASTLEDANAYWPQASDVTPIELVERAKFTPKPMIRAHVERVLCQALFVNVEKERQCRKLHLPPNR